MNHFREQSKFEIKPSIEQEPFESPAVQSFFTKWCEINDSIQPQVVTREQWDSRGMQEILEKRPDGKKTLFIPKDLQLWEMIGVMEVLDKDTFAAKPKRATEAKEKILALGRTFENAGVYIAKRLDGINEGREIAEALALELYQYGQSLTQGKTEEMLQIDDIALHNLAPQETEAVDRFLAGDTLYESRKQMVEKLTTDDQAEKDALYEAQRQKALAQFFRVAEKAFALKSKSAGRELAKGPTKLKPWQSDAPIHSAFLKRIERALTKQIETPKRELNMAIFRRGLEKLTSEMKESGWKKGIDNFFEKVNVDLPFEQRKLVDALRIAELKTELATIRELGDAAQISMKEREIADKIQKAVSNFRYQFGANNPSEMVASQYINCVGASMLGGALMKEAGLNYLVGVVPEHSVLFLVTSDGQVEWRDMRSTSSNERLTDEMIKGQKRDGKPLTIKDIVAFSQKPTPERLIFDVDSPTYRKKLPWVKEGQRQYVIVLEPEYGQYIQILNNTGNALFSLDRPEEAIEAYRQAIDVEPKYIYPYNGLGDALFSLDRPEEAIEAYRQAIDVDPKFAYSYNGLGNVLVNLGRQKEAIEAYQKFIDLANKKSDDYWIKRAEKIIAELKE